MARPKGATSTPVQSGEVLELEPDGDVLGQLNRKYVYCLAEENIDTGMVFDAKTNRPVPGPKYRQYTKVPLRSSIVWDGSDCICEDKEGNKIQGYKPGLKILSGHKPGKWIIRYYAGCTSLFAVDQPQDKATIDEFMKNTPVVWFVRGYKEIFGYEEMLKLYLDICSWNEHSPYRVPNSQVIFKMVDTESDLEDDAEDMDDLEKALDLAKNAKEKHMRVHAKFLGIPELDLITQYPLSPKALRTEYRKKAKENPAKFIETYNDKTILIQSWIETALKNGEIDVKTIPNKATMGKKGFVICDISGIKSQEGILNKLIEVSQLPEGAEFNEMLKAQYE
jgi:hypothetical protein